MQLYNTATRKIEKLEPLNSPQVTFYACGFTSYDHAHIGHARKYTNDDILKRTLQHLGYTVNHVMNITDVGHLESDADEGEDKMAKGAKKYNKSVQELSQFFTSEFLDMLKLLNIFQPEKLVKATEHIEDMIALIKTLEKKGHVYTTSEVVYFDTSTFPEYGKLSGQKLEEKQSSRPEVVQDSEKKNPADFALWFKRTGRHAEHAQYWDSPWGEGFPGWHIECSAMSMKYLSSTIDIHSGGIDHIPVHHENEIAQSESATGKQFVKHWFHSYFLMVEGTKMSKSLNNFVTLNDVHGRNIEPLALRYLLLQTHYRQTMNFTWESLAAAQSALQKLRSATQQLMSQSQRNQLSPEKLASIQAYTDRFNAALESDLQIPQALAVVWEVVKSNIPSEDKLDFILSADRVLGLQLNIPNRSSEEIPEAVQQLAEERTAARQSGDFDKADNIRKEIEAQGYAIRDTDKGYSLTKNMQVS